MNKRTKIAVAVVLMSIPLVIAIVLCLHRPLKPVPVRARQAPGTTEFVGVGVALRVDSQTHAILIQDIVPGAPAAEAGVTSGLIVSKVDDISMDGKSLADCVNLIRGPAGTTVRLELVTPDQSRTNTVELTRRKFKL